MLAIFKAKIFCASHIAKFNIPAVATGNLGSLPLKEGSLLIKCQQYAGLVYFRFVSNDRSFPEQGLHLPYDPPRCGTSGSSSFHTP